MQTVASRRTFVRHMAIGLPVVVGAAGITHVGLEAEVSQHGMHMPPEPQVESILRGLARIHNQLQRRPATADDARAIGVQVRTLAAYRLQANRDAVVVQAVRQGLDRMGRDAILDHQPDMEAMRQELIAFGFDRPAVSTTTGTRAERAAALDRLIEGGVTPYFDSAWFLLQNPEVFHLLANDPNKCDVIREMIRQMEVAAALMCTIAVILPVAAAECFAATSVLAALKTLEYFIGC
jgi:hypothetical protein